MVAISAIHKFNQIIGDLLETTSELFLRDFAAEHDLYMDKKGSRPARKGIKTTWQDLHGNIHTVDFVLEKDGSPVRIGTPAIFIETAWRRYAKHSRNKIQEIQTSILFLREAYNHSGPFYGVILAGFFTRDSIAQLEALHIPVLYFPYESVVSAFEFTNIDASYDERTPDTDFADKVAAWEILSHEHKLTVASVLIDTHREAITKFVATLKKAIIKPVELYTSHLSPNESVLHFLHGTGVQYQWTGEDHTQLIYPMQYHSCFVCYSNKDESLARRLYADLQAQGVRCWFAPEDLKIGDMFRARIDEAIRYHEKLLLILSESAVESIWVESEVEAALEKEALQKRLVLFPIRIDECVLTTDQAWAANLRRMRHIGDFTNWSDPQAYQQAFDRLLRDLKKADEL